MIHGRGTGPHSRRILAGFGFRGRVFALAMVAACSRLVLAAPPQTIRSVAALHSLTNDEAAHSIPVAFEATVTYHITGDSDLFVQDGDLAIYVDVPKNLALTPGDRVLVRGKTRASFRPDIVAESVTLLGHGAAPAPVPRSWFAATWTACAYWCAEW